MSWVQRVSRSSRSWPLSEDAILSASPEFLDAKYLDIIAVDNGNAFRSSPPPNIHDRDPWVVEEAWSEGFLKFRDRINLKFPYARLMLFSPLRLRGRKPTLNDAEYFLNCIQVRRNTVGNRPLLFIAFDTGNKLLGWALTQDDQKPLREQVLHEVLFGVICLGGPKQARLPPTKPLSARRPSFPFIMGQGEDMQIQHLRARRSFFFAEDPTWHPSWHTASRMPNVSLGLKHRTSSSLSTRSETFTSHRGLREYHSVYEKLEIQIRALRPYFLEEGSRIGDAHFAAHILGEIPGIADEDRPEKVRLMTNALFLAAENGRAEVAEVLISGHAGAAASVDEPDAEGLTPLAVASRHGFADVIKVLLKHDANINCRDADGKTPLILASEFGHESTVKLLLEYKLVLGYAVEKDATTTSTRQTALMMGARQGHTAIVERLLKKRAKVDLRDGDGRTALIYASEYGRNKTAQKLLDFEANVNATRHDKTTSLHIATSSGNEALVKILLRGGADYTMLNKDRKEAASLATSESINQLLLGAQVYDECSQEVPNCERIKDLLNQEADIEYRGPYGKTALQIAYDKKNIELQSVLENPPLTNGPLSYIKQRSHEKVQWPFTQDEHGCVVEVHGEIIDFHVQDGKEKRLRARPSPTLEQMIYRDQSIAADQTLSKGYTKGSEASFRYYHLPANNLTWVKDLLTRLALEQKPNRDAREFEDMLGQLLAIRDWRHLAVDWQRADKIFPCLRPQARPFNKPLPSRQQAEENVMLFMPYLHYETHSMYEDMAGVISHPPEKASTQDTHITERILHSYLKSDYPLHPRRTLDQFYYNSLDTRQRDSDQVVYRYTKATQGSPKMLMVDQLWLWILNDGKLLISSFPRQWKIKDEDRNNPLHDVQKTDVMSSILSKLNSQDRHEIHSAVEMAAFLAQYCFGTFFDPTRGLGEDLQFIEFFERSIGQISNQETILFQSLKRYLQNGRKNLIDDRSRKLQELLDISEEVILLDEIKDIRDELSIIDLVFDQQIRAVSDMVRILDHSSTFPRERKDSFMAVEPAKSTPTLVDTTGACARPKYSFEDLLAILEQHRRSVKNMNERALRVYHDIQSLLDLKQKQASVFEAEKARESAQKQAELLATAAEQAEATNRQGNTLMVFTLTTVVFLPASFMASFFAIQIDSFPKSNGEVNMPIKWVIMWLLIVTVAISGPLIVIAFYVNSLQRVDLFSSVKSTSILFISTMIWPLRACRSLPNGLRKRRPSRSQPAGTADEEANKPNH